MKLVNKTPHPVTINGATYQPDAVSARCSSKTVKVGDLDGIPLFNTVFGDVTGLPDATEGVVFIVSAITAQAVKGKRDDCFIVCETIRDEAGRIIGARGLARV